MCRHSHLLTIPSLDEPGNDTSRDYFRILRPGGILAAFSYWMPPTIVPMLEEAFTKVLNNATRLVGRKLWEGLESWPIVDHLEYMRDRDDYSYTKEIGFHQKKMGNAENFLGLVKNYGSVDRALKKGIPEAELGLRDLKALAEEWIGPEPTEWIFSYRMIVGVKKDNE